MRADKRKSGLPHCAFVPSYGLATIQPLTPRRGIPTTGSAMYFRVLLPEETKHYGYPGTALFMWLAAQLSEGAATLERDPAVEDSVKRRLDRIVVDVVARLLRERH
jgi:hypothetical protein